MTHELVLKQLLHELRSPLCLASIQAEKYEDDLLARSSRRMDWLLRFAAAAVSEGIEVAAAPLRRALSDAAAALGSFWPAVKVELPCDVGLSVKLPRDPEMALTLLVGWLEAALYGATQTTLVVDCGPASTSVGLRAEAMGPGARARDVLARRLCVAAAANLARLTGGRLIVSSNRPRACLYLKRAAHLAEQSLLPAAG